MNNEPKDVKEVIRNILSEAVDLTENRFSYTNNVQMYFGGSDVTLDFFFLGPNSKPNVQAAQAQRLQRIVLPYDVAKEMAEIILNGISQWEDAHGITLPLGQEEPIEEPEQKTNE